MVYLGVRLLQSFPHVASVAGALTLLAAEARAAENTYAKLRYEAGPDDARCPQEQAFRQKVAQRLGYDPFRPDADRELRVTFDLRGKEVRATLSLQNPNRAAGKRELSDARCEALADAVASAAALALDPIAAQRPDPPPEPQKAPTEEPKPVAPPLPPPPLPLAPVAQARAQEHGDVLLPRVYVDGAGTLARTPSIALGARAGAGVRYGLFSAAIEAEIGTQPSDALLTLRDRVSAWTLAGALAPCGHVDILEACGLLGVGNRQVKALDVLVPVARSTIFAFMGARVGVAYPLSRGFSLRLNATLEVPFTRTAYAVDGAVAYTSSPVDGGVGLGVGWILPR